MVQQFLNNTRNRYMTADEATTADTATTLSTTHCSCLNDKGVDIKYKSSCVI